MAACSAASASRRYWRSGHGHDEGPAAACARRRRPLAMLYDKPHDHTRWPDHVERVKETIDAGPRADRGDRAAGGDRRPVLRRRGYPPGAGGRGDRTPAADPGRPGSRLRDHRPGRADPAAAGRRGPVHLLRDDRAPGRPGHRAGHDPGAAPRRCCCPPRCASSTPATCSTTGAGTRTPSGSCWSGPAGPRCCTGRSAAKSSTARQSASGPTSSGGAREQSPDNR